MRLRDVVVLARTKFRVHRVRTGITTGIAGLMFGLLVLMTVVSQGVFESVDSFSEEGLSSRYAVQLTQSGGETFNAWDSREDPEFIARIEQAHAELVAKKRAAAQRYNIPYDPRVEDPSPIATDRTTGKKIISEEGFGTPIVTEVVERIAVERYKPFDPESYLKDYASAMVLGRSHSYTATDGAFSYMKDGKEENLTESARRSQEDMMSGRLSDSDMTLQAMPQTLAESFVTNEAFDASKGEIPVVLPHSHAEELLGLTPLDRNVSGEARLARANEVRQRIGEVTASFCYRNQASLHLLAQANIAAAEAERSARDSSVPRPPMTYTMPNETSCGAVEVASDTRTEAEKRAEESQRLYEQEIGTYLGEPIQRKIVVRGVGVTPDMSVSAEWSVRAVVQDMLTSSISGYGGVWSVPAGLLAELPPESVPEAVFGAAIEPSQMGGTFFFESYYVEFGDKEEARQLLERLGVFSGRTGDIYAMPFGSGSLIIDELKTIFGQVFFWVVLVMGVVAAIILSGLVGRTIADGRKETAVFRALGAKRWDMASVYLAYTLLFAWRIILFAFVLGCVVAGVVHLLYSGEATIGAQLAFGGYETNKQFMLIGFGSVYLLVIIGAIVAVGLLSAVLPILRNVRRNPIRDMRAD